MKKCKKFHQKYHLKETYFTATRERIWTTNSLQKNSYIRYRSSKYLNSDSCENFVVDSHECREAYHYPYQMEYHHVSYVAYSSSMMLDRNKWYFDSGCSAHMTGDKENLIDVQSLKERGRTVTFGDGAEGKVTGIGTLHVDGIPPIKNVLLVDGLKANLLSISQICSGGLEVKFTQDECTVVNISGEPILKGRKSSNNCYLLELCRETKCLMTKQSEVNEWHRKLGHLNIKTLLKISGSKIVRGLPILTGQSEVVCRECMLGKQVKANHPKTDQTTSKRILELMHMDLMGPMSTESIGGKRYAFVCVDDFSRFTWIKFLREKSETTRIIINLITQLQTETQLTLKSIRSDHGKEFENYELSVFCDQQGTKHQYSAPITPQQNGVAERKNRTIQEMARVMLHGKKIPLKFWAEAMNTAVYTINRVNLRPGTEKTCYEIWKGKKPTVKHFHAFGSPCYILRDREYRHKLDPKSDEGFFIGYSESSRAFRVFNLRSKCVMESINVKIDDHEDAGKFTRIYPAHFAAPIKASRSDFLAAFGFLDELLGECYVTPSLALLITSIMGKAASYFPPDDMKSLSIP